MRTRVNVAYGHHLSKPVGVSVPVALLDGDVLALDVAGS
jgi:hypothetical protein